MSELPTDISKEAILELPLFEYPADWEIVDSQSKLDLALKALNECPVIGFDTETKPNFRKGQYNPVAFIQLATAEKPTSSRFPQSMTGKASLTSLKTQISSKRVLQCAMTSRISKRFLTTSHKALSTVGTRLRSRNPVLRPA